MMYTLKNDHLKVAISSKGSELQSITDAEGHEYLWQGSDALRVKAGILFPFASWLYDSKYLLDGQVYEMPLCGFLLDKDAEEKELTDTCATYVFHADEETMRLYPRDFYMQVTYTLEGPVLTTLIRIDNRDTKPMRFNLGFHPTFQLPFENGLSFDDYRMTFVSACAPKKIIRKDNRYIGPESPFPLEGGTTYRLQDEKLAKEGVTVLTGVAKEVILNAGNRTRGVRVAYPDMNLFVLFHLKGTPFVTTEAWTSYMGKGDTIEDIDERDDLILLSPGETHTNRWTFGFD